MTQNRRRLTAALFGDEEREAPASQTAHCRCGETLDFGTDGMGRLVEWCPVCHGGRRPSKTRPAFTVRRCTRCTIPIAEGLPASVTMCKRCTPRTSIPLQRCADCNTPCVQTRCDACRPVYNRVRTNGRMREAR